MSTEEDQAQIQWVILEAMGHQKVGGRYFFENGLHWIDIPDPEDPDRFMRTEYYGNPAIFRITPVSEEAARLMAKNNIIPDAIPWDLRRELKQLAAPQETIEAVYPDDEDFDDDGPYPEDEEDYVYD